MGRKAFEIDRREFVRHGVGMGAGALALGRLPQMTVRSGEGLQIHEGTVDYTG